MKLIVGLGNIGNEYHTTRHNLGFAVVEMLGITFGHQPNEFKKHSKSQAEVLNLKQTHNCMLVKPTTMMNLSGQAVGELVRFYNIEAQDVWLVYDDVDIEFGNMRVRLGGGSAGHNGVKSVAAHIGDDFWRIRVGVANKFLATTPTDAFVLSPFMTEEAAEVPKILKSATDYLESALLAGALADHSQKVL